MKLNIWFDCDKLWDDCMCGRQREEEKSRWWKKKKLNK